MRGSTTRNVIMTMSVAGTCMFAYSCATDGYNAQRGAAIGAIGGALAGQVIGGNTTGTLIGVAAGAPTGAMAGNAEDQRNAQYMANAPYRPTHNGPLSLNDRSQPGAG